MTHLKRRLRSLDLDALTDLELIAAVLASLLLIAGIFWIGFALLDPAPPHVLVISAGRPGGGYWAAAQRYRERFANTGIALEVRESSGSIENLARLKDPTSGVSIALVQSGTGGEAAATDGSVESLASLYYEPIFVFHRLPGSIYRLSQLRGKRIVVGDPGSGTLAAAEELLAANGVDQQNSTYLTESPEVGERMVEGGQADAVFVIAAADSPVVQQAFSHALALVDFEQDDAYVRRYGWLSKVSLPRGSVNLGQDYPPADVRLLAPTANLLVRSDLNPALSYLLLEIATEVHGGAGLFQRSGEFPAVGAPGFPASAEAKRFFQSGKPFFQRYLPFWAANRVERTLVVVVPFLLLLLPAMRVVPAVLRWRKKARINRLYGELRDLEARFAQLLEGSQDLSFVEALNEIEHRTSALHLPLQFGSDLYQLRARIQMLRDRAESGSRVVAR